MSNPFVDIEVEDRKPSELLQHMRTSAGNSRIDDAFIRNMWLQGPSSDMQNALCVSAAQHLDAVT